MGKIQVNDFILSFAQKLRQASGEDIQSFSGSRPKYPMAVVYLGKKSAGIHEKLRDMLVRIWPPFREELCFLGVGDDQRFFLIEGEEAGGEMEEPQLRTEINRLFGLSTHFLDRNRMMVYYVLDTTEISSEEEMKKWEEIISWIKEELKAEGQMSMLLVLLNEDFEHVDQARAVKNEIGESVYGSPRTMPADSVFLVSNRRNDNVIISDWYECCRILANIIALSNGRDADVTNQMFAGNNVKTVSYSLVEKPTQEIAQVVVSSVIRHLNQVKKGNIGVLADENLDKKLGITREGTIKILDEYEEDTLEPMLPTPEELESFPRYTDDENMVAAVEMTEEEFDILTMNAWSAYLKKIIGKAERKIHEGAKVREEWKKKYRVKLRKAFSPDELIYLADSEMTLRKRFKRVTKAGKSDRVLQAAGNRLKYMLSTNEQLIGFFLECIHEEGLRCKAVVSTWSELVKSLNQLFEIADENLTEFYERKVQRFFDRNGTEKARQFNRLGSVEELKRFLEEILQEIRESDPIFQAPFEEELQARLDAASDPMDARSYIRSRLTGEEVKTYLRVSFSLQSTALSAILLKKDTELYQSMVRNLADNIYYYNTGTSDRAEALVMYQVDVSNLVS